MRNAPCFMRNALLLVSAVLLWSCSSSLPESAVEMHEVDISNIGAAINSAVDEFSPSITANGTAMVFTRGISQAPFHRDFYVSRLDGGFWTSARELDPPVRSEKNEGAPSVSSDGQTLFFAAENRENGQGSSDIYRAMLEGKQWGDVVNLGFPVNTVAWESHPSIAPDGKTLYFSSNRDGGVGGLDIWKTELDMTGMWKIPVNLGPSVNTDDDEVSPYIASDGRTLYFASEGHPGLGGTDMFVTRLIAKEWSKPQNLGRPLNSTENDEFFTLAAEGRTVFFSSRREGGFGGLDLYRAEPNPFPPEPVFVLSGVVRDQRSKEPLRADITVHDSLTGEMLSTQKSNEYSGEYVVVLTAGSSWKISADAPGYRGESTAIDLRTLKTYQERRHNFFLRKDGPLDALSAHVTCDVMTADFSLLRGGTGWSGLTVEEIVTSETMPLLNYIFFKEGRSDIPARYTLLEKEAAANYRLANLPHGTLERYYHLLNIIGYRLRQRPKAEITLTGTTDGRETGSVALERTEEIKRYFVTVWDVHPRRIKVQGRGLPLNPSSTRSREGLEENRRVEITSTDAELLAPLQMSNVQRVLKPERATFHLSILAQAGLERWSFEIRHGEQVLRGSDGYSLHPDSIVWNWKTPSGELTLSEKGYTYSLTARDKEGNEVTTGPDHLPVNLITLEKKQLQQLPDRTLEKVSLILFDFDRSDLGPRNKRMLGSLQQRLDDKSTILVRGYTDALGESAYNLKLSGKRADAVRKQLQSVLPAMPIRSEGVGESDLLFNNARPEGRFYCRTVQVLIETIK